jgi:hypothetical protein
MPRQLKWIAWAVIALGWGWLTLMTYRTIRKGT